MICSHCSTQCIAIVLSIFLVTALASTVQRHDSGDVHNKDYPEDTHGGAVKAFSQLVADDNLQTDNLHSRLIPEFEEEVDTTVFGEDAGDDESTDIMLEGFEDPEDTDSMETQYLIEELYGYTYDEAVDDDDD